MSDAAPKTREADNPLWLILSELCSLGLNRETAADFLVGVLTWRLLERNTPAAPHRLARLTAEEPFARLYGKFAPPPLAPQVLLRPFEVIEQTPIDTTEGRAVIEQFLMRLEASLFDRQFWTPAWLARLAVELLQPRSGERIADPACGTGRFLLSALEFLQQRDGPGAGSLFGLDVHLPALRLAALNLLLRGLKTSDLHYLSALSEAFPARLPQFASNAFDLILTAPPVGLLTERDIDPSLLSGVRANRSEFLFVSLVLRMLRPGGRAALVVPAQLLSGMSKGHLALRATLIESNRVLGVVGLPRRSHSSLPMALLLLQKGQPTDAVWFCNALEGTSVDRQGSAPEPAVLENVRVLWQRRAPGQDRTGPGFVVPRAEIAARNLNLDGAIYRPASSAGESAASPLDLLEQLQHLERAMSDELERLSRLLRRSP